MYLNTFDRITIDATARATTTTTMWLAAPITTSTMPSKRNHYLLALSHIHFDYYYYYLCIKSIHSHTHKPHTYVPPSNEIEQRQHSQWISEVFAIPDRTKCAIWIVRSSARCVSVCTQRVKGTQRGNRRVRREHVCVYIEETSAHVLLVCACVTSVFGLVNMCVSLVVFSFHSDHIMWFSFLFCYCVCCGFNQLLSLLFFFSSSTAAAALPLLMLFFFWFIVHL